MITYSATRCNNSAIRSKYFNIAIIYVRTNIGKIDFKLLSEIKRENKLIQTLLNYSGFQEKILLIS